MVLDAAEQEKSFENVSFALVKKTSVECRQEYDNHFEAWGSEGEYKGYIEDPEPGKYQVQANACKIELPRSNGTKHAIVSNGP